MPGSIRERLLSRQAAILLLRNTGVSIFVFLFDLGLLWLLVERGGIGKLLAAALAFAAANTLHYALGRIWIFKGSARSVAGGYLYFLMIAAVGLVLTMVSFALLMEIPGLHYIIARIIASVVAGLAVFVLNALFNFRVL